MEREDHGNHRSPRRLFADLQLGPIIVSGALCSLLTIVGMTLANRVRPAPIYIEPPPPTVAPGPTATPEPITVFVNGFVARPEIYKLSHDSIIDDAITAAGGFTADAHVDIVNLAQPLHDGMQVYVPSRVEVGDQKVPVVSSSLGDSSGIVSDGPSAGEMVDINTASKATLETLPGVGPSTAQKILDHREDNGPFTIIEDIMNVSGIGPSKFEQMAPFITVDR